MKDSSSINFSMVVEHQVNTEKCSYIDAITYLCDKYDIEFDLMKSALSRSIKEKVEFEAKQLNMLIDNEVPRSLF